MEPQSLMNDENNYNYETQINLIEDNVNISKTSDIKEFFILTTAIIVMVCGIFFVSDIVMQIFINNMSYQTQRKIENFLNEDSKHTNQSTKANQKEILELQKIQKKLEANDLELKKFKKLEIGISDNKEINAYIYPNGEIYFTKGILKELKSEDQKAFVLAHEIAHYKNRDHLKSIGRSILALATINLIGLGGGEFTTKIMYSIYNINDLKYSQKQEIEADKYAGKLIKKIYGTNKGATEFFKLIDQKQHFPEFIHYFSTHPSPSTRIKLIEETRL